MPDTGRITHEPVGSRLFFYPCAGYDYVDPVLQFGEQFDAFIFTDLTYRFDQFPVPRVPGWVELSDSISVTGPASSLIQTVINGRRRYREVEPAWRRSRLRHLSSGREIAVTFRRGFGQYALHELPEQSLSMFLHRGDSLGEGGSNTSFFANVPTRHLPLSNLFDVLKQKLVYPALLASDGSNTRIPELFQAANGDESIREFASHGLYWKRLGVMAPRAGRQAVVWLVVQSRGRWPLLMLRSH